MAVDTGGVCDLWGCAAVGASRRLRDGVRHCSVMEVRTAPATSSLVVGDFWSGCVASSSGSRSLGALVAGDF
jgi:hypothetical protein